MDRPSARRFAGGQQPDLADQTVPKPEATTWGRRNGASAPVAGHRVKTSTALVVLCAVAAQAQPPVSDFTSQSEVAAVSISPTGRYITATIRQGERSEFQILTHPEREFKVQKTLGDAAEVAAVTWLSDELALMRPAYRVFGTDIKAQSGQLATINAETGHVRRSGGGTVLDTLPDDPKEILVAVPTARFAEAFRVNIRSGSRRRVARSAAPQGAFVPSGAGEVLVSIGVSTENYQEIHTRGGPGQRWNLVASYALDEEGWVPVHFGPRPNTYYTYDSRGDSTAGLGLYDAATDTHKMIVRHPSVDVSSLLYDFANRSVYGVRFDHHYPQVMYINRSHPLAQQHASLQKMFPDDTVALTSTTRDHRLAIAHVSGDRRPGDYFLVDVEEGKLELLRSSKPQFKPEDLSPMSPIELEVRDGSKIYGYLTSAPTAQKPGPMVVYVHGGPHGIRDFWGYDAVVQLLASRGFHVLQVNYRGSGGYGVDYQRSGFGEWGRQMQDDVTDATRWAVQKGVADPDRICIHGISYGAYSALMGVAKEPDLYRCAVGYAGIYDLTIMDSKGDVRRRRAGEQFIRRVLGSDEATLVATSPAHQANRIRAKVMLIHGGNDYRAPVEHAYRMRDALRKAGNEPEWVFDHEQGHGFAGNAARLDVYERILAFLKTHTDTSGESVDTSEGFIIE